MITCQSFLDILKNNGFTFFTGIPDSIFKDFIKFLEENHGKNIQNLVCCNECEAIALGVGYYLATNKIAVVYMQNSGLGKAINPLTSLCDPDVYSIPILLMIGWRGEPGKTDAQQHKKMGKILTALLETLEIPYKVLEPKRQLIDKAINDVKEFFKKNNAPYAFLIKRGFFQDYESKTRLISDYELTREDAIVTIMNHLEGDEVIISTTGYNSREVYEYREKNRKDHYNSFYNIGSMGCAISIGLSIALQKPNKKILVFDGDGAIIMQMGAFTTIGRYLPKNLVHIIFDNHMYETTGDQPSNSASVSFLNIALACNYKEGKVIPSKLDLVKYISNMGRKEGPLLIRILIKPGTRSNLKRPEKDVKIYKNQLINSLIKK